RAGIPRAVLETRYLPRRVHDRGRTPKRRHLPGGRDGDRAVRGTGRRKETAMLNWKLVAKSLGSFAAISYVLCIGAGLLIPSSVHTSWLLEAMLPGFKWLSPGSFVLGLVEASIYGAWAGVLYSALYNFFARRERRNTTSAAATARVA